MNYRFRYPQCIQELIAQALAQMSIRHQPGHVNQLDGDKTLAILAPTTAFLDAQFLTRAGNAHIGDAMIGINSSKRIIGNIHFNQGRCLEKSGFAGVWLSSQPDREHMKSVILYLTDDAAHIHLIAFALKPLDLSGCEPPG
jgi:hypothetical protein